MLLILPTKVVNLFNQSIVYVSMCTVLLPLGVNPIAVNKPINISIFNCYAFNRTRSHNIIYHFTP